jgi:LPS sulfotransferase NodH
LAGSAQAQVVQRDTARPFAIVAAQRTGSTLLARSLDSSPFIYCAGEIFHDGSNIYHPEWRLPRPWPGVTMVDWLLGGRIQRSGIKRHLGRYFASAGESASAVGFKVMTPQLRRFPGLLPLLSDLGVTMLFLHRRDSFATALSYAKARFTNVYHSDRVVDNAGTTIVRMPDDEFGALLERCVRAKREVLALHRERGGTLLAYEDMVDDWSGVIASIGRLLDLPALQVEQTLDKLGRSGNRVIIENEDELRRRYYTAPPA